MTPLRIPSIILTCAMFVFGAASFAADPAPQPQPNPNDAKLRSALQKLQLELREMQAERDKLAAEKLTTAAEMEALKAESDKVSKELAETRQTTSATISANSKQIDTLTKQLTDAEKAIKDLGEKFKASVAIGAAAAASAKKFEAELLEARRVIADRERKNLELFTVGSEILSKYESFGLGTALTSREPFTGITKVKLKSLVQDYQDKLADQTIKR